MYSPTPTELDLPVVLQGAQGMRFNWGPDPLLGLPNTDDNVGGCTEPQEDTVAFFGAVDSRPLLFFISVTLLSVRRFHPRAGFFVLVPKREAGPWAPLLRSWTGGAVQLLELEDEAAKDFGNQRADGYSRMTFHRHRVPELLVQQGFAFSINLDPDILCVQPWDLRILCNVGLVGGRRVGKGSRMIRWLQDQLISRGRPADPSGLAGFLNQTLGITPKALSRIPEINGGVVVFNNLRAIREQWLGIIRQRFHSLADIVEGDQDLISAPSMLLIRPLAVDLPRPSALSATSIVTTPRTCARHGASR